jgi:TctA family transporter
MLLLSIKNKTIIPPQKIENPKINFLRPLIGSAIASPLCGFLPGLGSGQAAVLGNSIARTDEKGFLALVGATNIVVMSISFLAIYLISRMRTGAAVAVSDLIGEMTINILILIISCIIVSGVIAFFVTEHLSRKLANKINKVNYSKLSFWTLCFLSVMTIVVSGFSGFLIYIISTFTGIYCIKKNVKKTNMMGCLIIPTIIIYLF